MGERLVLRIAGYGGETAADFIRYGVCMNTHRYIPNA